MKEKAKDAVAIGIATVVLLFWLASLGLIVWGVVELILWIGRH